MYSINKNISVWRGILSPPTHSHIWIKDDNLIYHYEDREWQPLYKNASKTADGLMSKTDKQILDMLNENLHWN